MEVAEFARTTAFATTVRILDFGSQFSDISIDLEDEIESTLAGS
jgi:hypothetical protein